MEYMEYSVLETFGSNGNAVGRTYGIIPTADGKYDIMVTDVGRAPAKICTCDTEALAFGVRGALYEHYEYRRTRARNRDKQSRRPFGSLAGGSAQLGGATISPGRVHPVWPGRRCDWLCVQECERRVLPLGGPLPSVLRARECATTSKQYAGSLGRASHSRAAARLSNRDEWARKARSWSVRSLG